MRRSSWLGLLTLAVGFSIGVLYSWAISPMRYVNTVPSALRADFKDSFRSAIAASYAATGNLDRARARLSLLGDPDPVQALTAQAQRMLASGEAFQTVQEVASLATDLRAGVVSLPPSPSSTAVAILAQSPAPPSPTGTGAATDQVELFDQYTSTAPAATAEPLLPTPTARPTHTPMPTASAPFQLVSQDEVCNPNLTDGLMQVSVLDSHRHQMPGMEIEITWNGGDESFFTGMKPEIGDGYADYVLQPGVTYSVRVERSGAPVGGLSAPSCPDSSGQTYVGGLKLVFQQP